MPIETVPLTCAFTKHKAATTLAPLLVSAVEAQRLLGGISRRGLHDLIKKRSLPSVKIGSRLMFRPEQLAAWIDGQQKSRVGKSEES